MPRTLPFLRLVAPLLLVGLTAFSVTGCTKAARLKRREEKADRAFAAGHYEEAEIDYLNVLHANGSDGDAVGHLGVIYYDQGREERAFSYLVGARTLAPEYLDARLRLGLCYLTRGQFSAAAAEATYVLERDPGNPMAPALLAEAQPEPKGRAAARTRLEQLPENYRSRAPVQTALAVLALHDGKKAGAVEGVAAALAADPHFSMAHSLQASIALARKDAATAEQEYKAASESAPARSPWRLQYARFRLQQGDANGAAALAERLIKEAPDFIPAYMLLAQIQDQQKHPVESLATVEKILGREPSYREAVLQKGTLLLEKGDWAATVAYLEKSANLFPHNAPFEFALARAYLAAGDSGKAKAALVTTLAWQPDLPEAAQLLAQRDLQDGDPAGAVAVLLPITKAHPDLTSPRFELASAYLAQTDYDSAIAIFSSLSGTAPHDPQFHVLAGMAQGRLGHSAAARKEFEAALAIDADYLPALERMVYLDLDEKKFPDAERRVRARIAAKPQEAESYGLLAQVLFTRKAVAEAEQSAKTAIQLKPSLPLPYVLLAKQYFLSNQLDLAVHNIAAAVDRDPNDIESLLLKGTIDSQANDFKGAQAAYERALALYPNSGPALNNLAVIYAENLRNLPKALELAQHARTSLPNDPNVADTLGWIALSAGQYTWARSLLLEAAAGLPADPSARYHLAKAEYVLGDETAAREDFRKSLALGGAFAGHDDAARLVAILNIDPSAPRPGDDALLEKQLAASPNDAAILSRLAAIYRAEGQLDKGLDAAERAVKANPNDLNAAIVLAQLYVAKNAPARAYEVVNEAHKRAPQNAGVSSLLGELAFEKGDFPWSLSLLRSAHTGRPDDPEVLLALARSEYSEGQVIAAVRDARAAAALPSDRTVAKAAQEFAGRAAVADDPVAASAESAQLEKYAADHPKDVPTLMALAVAALAHGDAPGAQSRLETILSIYPDFLPAERQLLLLYAVKGEAAKGASMVAKVREALPNDPLVAKAGGIIFYRSGDLSKASDLLANAAQQLSDDSELEFYWGMALKGQKDPKARSHLQRAIELHLSPQQEKDAEKALKSDQ